MKVSEVMANHTPEAAYKGQILTDDFIFAIEIPATGGGTTAVHPDDYVVARDSVTTLGPTMNPITQDKNYLAGPTSTKTGQKRQFTVEGDVLIGDAFQDYILSHDIKFGTGSKVVVNFVYFCFLTGKGEKGQANIIVNEDGSGDAQNNAGFSVDFVTIKDPEEYTYAAKTP